MTPTDLKDAQRYAALKSAIEFGQTEIVDQVGWWALAECGTHPLMLYAPTLDALADLLISKPICPVCAERGYIHSSEKPITDNTKHETNQDQLNPRRDHPSPQGSEAHEKAEGCL